MTVSAPQRADTLGDYIERLYTLRERTRELNKELEDVKEAYKETEAAIMQAMDAQETEIARSPIATASIKSERVAQVTDWDALYAYIKETDQLYLLHRRVANANWRELIDSGETVPGTKTYTKRSISLKTR